MSNNKRRVGSPRPLPSGSVDFLCDALAAIRTTTPLTHAKRVDRLAVSFRPCKRDVERLPQERIVFDAFRLFALSHRWVERHGRVAGMVVLGIFKPEVDLPGSGRFRFRCEGAMSVGLRQGSIAPDPRTNPTAARAAVVMTHEVEDASYGELEPFVRFPRFYFAFDPRKLPVREEGVSDEAWAASTMIGNLRAWEAEVFARPAGKRWDVHPVDGSPDPWKDSTDAVAEGTISGTWILRDGVPTPLTQTPVGVFASLEGLDGRTIRNPAWQVLAERGVIPAGMSYRQ